MPYKINYSNCFLSIDGAVPDASLANAEATMYLDTTSKDIILRFRDDVGSLHTTVLGESDSFTPQEILFGDTDGSFAQTDKFKYDATNNSLMFGSTVQTTTATGAGILGGSSNGVGSTADNSFVIGGTSNQVVTGVRNVILGGTGHISNGTESAIVGGGLNTISSLGQYSAVIGSVSSSVTGPKSVVVGGAGNVISGTDSVAIGTLCSVGTNKSFMWNGSGISKSGTVNDSFYMFPGSSGSVSIGDITPNASALLHLTSTTQGFKLMHMTTTERNAIASPAPGLMVFDNTINQFMGWNTSAWVILG